MCTDVRDPLLGDVVEGGWVDHAEAEKEDVCVSVRQGPEFVKLLLRWTDRGEDTVSVEMQKWKVAPALYLGKVSANHSGDTGVLLCRLLGDER